VLSLNQRPSVLKFSLATGDVVVSASGDVFSMSVNDIVVCLLKGMLAPVSDAADTSTPAATATRASGWRRTPSSSRIAVAQLPTNDISRIMKPFHFTPVLPDRFNLLLTSNHDVSWFFTNSRIRFRTDNPEAYVLLHDFPIFDSKRMGARPNDLDGGKGCEVRRVAKGHDVTSVKLVILDESQYKVAFQHRNLTLTWCLAPASAAPVVYWSESNPHSPSNNNSFF
jgi:hypothetical protein